MRLVVVAVALAGAAAIPGCGGDDDEGDVQAFCDKVIEIDDAPDPFAAAKRGDFEGVEASLDEFQELSAQLTEVAPEEIKADVEQAEQSFAEFADEAREATTPNEFLRIALRVQEENQEFVAASQRIGEYTAENCPQDGDGST